MDQALVLAMSSIAACTGRPRLFAEPYVDKPGGWRSSRFPLFPYGEDLWNLGLGDWLGDAQALTSVRHRLADGCQQNFVGSRLTSCVGSKVFSFQVLGVTGGTL